MRSLTTTDFEASNIEEVEFWVMDPYNEDSPYYQDNNASNYGDLYINLGSVSEDVLRDSRRSFENGLPTGPGRFNFNYDRNYMGFNSNHPNNRKCI